MCTIYMSYTHSVEVCVRTNIEIDDHLMKRALKATGLSTKREVVEEGLRLLIKLRGQGKLREMFGKYPMDNDLEESRLGREF
jgi:Arc/MetJ family transcription regulator